MSEKRKPPVLTRRDVMKAAAATTVLALTDRKVRDVIGGSLLGTSIDRLLSGKIDKLLLPIAKQEETSPPIDTQLPYEHIDAILNQWNCVRTDYSVATPATSQLISERNGIVYVHTDEIADVFYRDSRNALAVSYKNDSVLLYDAENKLWRRIVTPHNNICVLQVPRDIRQGWTPFITDMVTGIATHHKLGLPIPIWIDALTNSPYHGPHTIEANQIIYEPDQIRVHENHGYMLTEGGVILDIQHVKGFGEIALIADDHLTRLEQKRIKESEELLNIFIAWTDEGIKYGIKKSILHPDQHSQILEAILYDVIIRTEAYSQMGAVQIFQDLMDTVGKKTGLTSEDMFSNFVGASLASKILSNLSAKEKKYYINNRREWRQVIMQAAIDHFKCSPQQQSMKLKGDIKIAIPTIQARYVNTGIAPIKYNGLRPNPLVAGFVNVRHTTMVENTFKTLSHHAPAIEDIL